VSDVNANVFIQDSENRLSIRELWQRRELLYFLAWRDIKVRYKQTVLGVLWAVIQPLVTALMLTLFWGRVAGVSSGGVAYLLFAYIGMAPWQFFSHTLTEVSNSFVANERLITKVYFPRVAVPLSSVLAGLVDFGIALLLMIPLLTYFRVAPSVTILAVPLLILLLAAAAFGAGLWLSVLNIRYRDVRYTLGFLIQIWFLASPVAYPSSVVPERWRLLYALNPMAGIIEGFRWAVLSEGGTNPAQLVVLSVAGTAVILAGGLYYFRHMEATFADII
jgi:lipopolysaccharide transport system permease protein